MKAAISAAFTIELTLRCTGLPDCPVVMEDGAIVRQAAAQQAPKSGLHALIDAEIRRAILHFSSSTCSPTAAIAAFLVGSRLIVGASLLTIAAT